MTHEPAKLSAVASTIRSVTKTAIERPDRDGEIERLLTAAIRAGDAWAHRTEDSRAYREVSLMLGVVLHAQATLGSSSGVSGPLDLIERLQKPLAELVGVDGWSDPVGGVAVLNDREELTEEVLEFGAEYACAVFTGADEDRTSARIAYEWIRAEQVERKVYERMKQGSDEEYTATRRFLVEQPAGLEDAIIEELRVRGALRAAEFVPIPSHRSAGKWWWPCPVCRWPMRVDGVSVRCDMSVHRAKFRLAAAGVTTVPELKVRGGGVAAPPPQTVAGAVCVEEPVWRYMVVPGVAELDLEQRLREVPDVNGLAMWPGKDRCDLAVTAVGNAWEVDVKDHVSHTTIVRRPITARHIVVPDYRANQVTPLQRRLGKDHEVRTAAEFVALVEQKIRGHRGL